MACSQSRFGNEAICVQHEIEADHEDAMIRS